MARIPEPLICALCERQVSKLSKHHIIPKSKGGKDTVGLCSPCHSTLHAFFTNGTLAAEMNTIEALREQPTIQDYLKWIRKQPDRRIQVAKRRERL